MIILNNHGSNPNFFYETGLDISDVIFIKDGKSSRIFGHSMNMDFDKKAYRKTETFDMKKILRLVKGKEVGMDFLNENVKFYSEIRKSAKKVIDISEDYLVKRSFKSEDEARLIKSASRKTKEIIFGLDIRKGMTEMEIAKKLKKETIDQGLGLSFEPIIASGINSSYPHSVPTSRKIGSFVMIDFGVIYNHYCSDITEVVFLDKKSREFGLYGKIRESFNTMLDNLSDCYSGNDVHLNYINSFRQVGLPQMPHSIGHGVGLEVHEYPRLRKGSKDRIRGTVFTLEPAVYYKGNFGLRLERDIFVNKSGKVEVF
ncbi:MAG: M24 family metallopeptidase [Candidatus Micrarchaeota archaeon]|nr:M24 family metallopeptidase [Candidatus Micrarchaeota archaeon]